MEGLHPGIVQYCGAVLPFHTLPFHMCLAVFWENDPILSSTHMLSNSILNRNQLSILLKYWRSPGHAFRPRCPTLLTETISRQWPSFGILQGPSAVTVCMLPPLIVDQESLPSRVQASLSQLTLN